MSSYHIQSASDDGNSVQVVMHIVVPSGVNLAGKAWATCLVEDIDWVKTSSISISAAEQAALDAGTLIEKVIAFETHRDVPNATKQARIDQRYRDIVVATQDAIRRRYWAWGYERTV